MSYLPLHRGTILRNMTPGSVEVAVVLGPQKPSRFFEKEAAILRAADWVECVHGWVNSRPAAGLFSLCHQDLLRGIWKVATEEDAAIVRALFLAHAQDWGPDSNAWVVAEPDSDTWATPPIAQRCPTRWTKLPLRRRPRVQRSRRSF